MMVGTELDNLVARLAGRDEVDGIVFVGSTGTEHMAPTSDYDVLLVLADSAPPFLVGLATFDHRVTDLLFATVGEIEQLLTGVQPPPDDWRYRVAHWIRSGTIVFDHNGRLARLRRVLVAGANRPELRSGHGTWFSLNYDLAQNRRLAKSIDAVDQTALEIRLLRGTVDLVTGYFALRGIDWPGEKEAMRHLAAQDPDHLVAVRACVQAPDRDRRFERYEGLAERTLEPFGGVWDGLTPIFQFTPETTVTSHLIREAGRYWSEISQEAITHANPTDGR